MRLLVASCQLPITGKSTEKWEWQLAPLRTGDWELVTTRFTSPYTPNSPPSSDRLQEEQSCRGFPPAISRQSSLVGQRADVGRAHPCPPRKPYETNRCRGPPRPEGRPVLQTPPQSTPPSSRP